MRIHKVLHPYPRTAPCAINCRADGDQICAMIGPDLQTGVAGFGDTLPDALRDLARNIECEVGYDSKSEIPENLYMLEYLLTELNRIRATRDLPTQDDMVRIYGIMDAT